jgi:hypothetical protein
LGISLSTVSADIQATITTDQNKYSVGQTMTISGAGFTPGDAIGITVLRPDKAIDYVWADGVSLPVVADANGTFTAKYLPSDPVVPGRYKITATDKVNTATTASTEADALGFSLAQCAQNDSANGQPLGLGFCNWIGSDLNANNSHLFEGIATEQQLIITGISGSSHTLIVGIQATKGGHHAYDWLVSDAKVAGGDSVQDSTLNSEKASALTGINLLLNRCGSGLGNQDKATCAALVSGATIGVNGNTVDINVPDDPFISKDGATQNKINAYETGSCNLCGFGNRTVRLVTNAPVTNPTMTLVHSGSKSSGPTIIPNGGDTGDSYIWYTITWQGSPTSAMLVGGADIALGGDGTGRSWGPGLGATNISGDPYHFYLISFDGTGGSLDNQMSAGAIFLQPATTLTTKSVTPNPAEVGSTVTVVVTETNTGNVALTNVNVTGGGACASFSPPAGFTGSLAVGASADFTCTFVAALPSPDSWSADGHGTDPNGVAVPATNEHTSGTVNVTITPATTLTTKSVTPNPAEIGATVTVVVTETNTGDVPLTNVNVSGGGKCISFSPANVATLAVGASQDFTCTFVAALPSPDSWSADGHGTDPNGVAVPATNEHTSGTVNVVSASTLLTFVSQVPGPGAVQAGTLVTITVNEANTGNSALTGVSVTGSPCAIWTGPTTLPVGANANFTCTFTAAVGTNNWSADGHGTDSLGNPVPATNEHAQGSFSGVLSTLVVVKNTVGGNGTFNFIGTGAGVPSTFPLTTSGGTQTVIFPGILSGPKSVAEVVPAGWVGDTTNVQCAETFAGITPSIIGTLTTGQVSAGGTVSANITNLGIGATVTCVFTNALLPTLQVVKTVQGTGTTTFTFPVSGANTLSPSITPPAAPASASFGPVPIAIGNDTISESGPPAGWTLTDFTCSGYTGGGTGAGPADSNGVPTNWNFTATYGDQVVCTFVNNSAQASRTQGFWATHTLLSNDVWDGNNPLLGTVLPAGATAVIGSGDEVFGPGAGCSVAFTITAIPTTGQNILMGGFWAGISQMSGKGGKRSSIDQARMQMMQQYLAAVLNYHMFGSIGESVLASARAAYCGTNQSAIQAQIGILGNLNQAGDTLGTTPGGSATTQTSKAQADIDAWDTPTNPKN